MRIQFQKVNLVIQGNVDRIIIKNIELEILDSMAKVIKCCLSETHLYDAASLWASNEFCWECFNNVYRIGLNLRKINAIVQYDVVSQIKFCGKLRQLSDQLEEWVIGKGFSMSPSWNPNTEAELEEEDLDYSNSSCKDPWWKDLRKKIFGEDNRVQISGIEKTVDMSMEEDVVKGPVEGDVIELN